MIKILIFTSSILFSIGLSAQHPSLSLTAEGVKMIKENLNAYPLFYDTYLKAKSELDHAIQKGVDVPFPKDMAGGYTHEEHKRNYKLLQKAGSIYQISGEEKYATFVKNVLFEYAKLYPTITLHPADKSYARGKLFWQCLNDANWMVFVSQAYDCIYDTLTKKEREHLESDLFIPFANFLSEGNPKFFNRIHNHSTWANAAVGMMALAMGHEELLQKALYGLENDGIDPESIDNDGGYIKMDGVRQAGFLAQLDYSFSPDGYFPEGPYYLRYAIFPFLKFSYALHNNKPELDIFNYRNGILQKATHTLLQLTDPSGQFFPINDAQKGMNFTTYELVTAVDIMYSLDPTQTELLSWAAAQNDVTLNEAGFNIAKNLGVSSVPAPVKQPILLEDGVNGKEGGIGVLRDENLDVLFKFSTQGMGHGHFDRLSYSMHDQFGEIIQDYGAVRWVNIDQKGGGRYLPENKTFGKHSVGHNALVVDQISHYKASVKKAEQAHPHLYLFDVEDNIQVISATEDKAYSDVSMQRSLFLINDEEFHNPILVDLIQATSDHAHSYDLPTWYTGQIMRSNTECEGEMKSLHPLGDDYGYQHIWKESSCKTTEENHIFNWYTNKQFYTLLSTAHEEDEFILGRAGANDPNHNLRPDPVLIQRRQSENGATFLNVIESHGHYSTVTEVPIRPYGSLTKVGLDYNDDNYSCFHFETEDYRWQVLFSTSDQNKNTSHSIQMEEKEVSWTGPYKLIKSKKTK